MKQFITGLLTFSFAGIGIAATLSEISDSSDAPLSNIYDLEAHFVECQNQFLPISPPSDDIYLHSNTSILPVKWKKFPKEFK